MGEGAKEEEDLETHPAPGRGTVAAPDGSDRGFAAQDDVEDAELQARGEIEQDQTDKKADHCGDEDDAQDGRGDRWRGTAARVSVMERLREGEAGAQHLGEERDGGDLEEESRVARTEQEPVGVLPGWSDGVGGRERLHAAPLLPKSILQTQMRGQFLLRDSCEVSSFRRALRA